MRLSRADILGEMEHDLNISPLDEEQVQPGSVDLRLGGDHTYLETMERYDIRESTPSGRQQVADDTITVKPGQCVLATTQETVSIPSHLDGEVRGRSSVGRLFLHIHTAGYIDPGFEGEITLEIVNHSENTYDLPVGMRICQLTFNYLHTPVESGYAEKDDAKYADQQGATASRISEDF